MYRIAGVRKDYAWGSMSAIPELMGEDSSGRPIAEVWYGAHPGGPSPILGEFPLGGAAKDLRELVTWDTVGALGVPVTERFDGELPFLLKLIAPAHALSLQVHPTRDRAAEGFREEEAAGIPADSPLRSYKDRNHKPEMVFALTQFEAMCGFRAPRRAAELFAGLGTPLSERIARNLAGRPDAGGVRAAFTALFSRGRPTPEEVAQFAEACGRRLAAGSPSTRADRTVVKLHEQHPGDPGVVASLLLNPVTLRPGEALFVPAGCVHTYLSGLAVEVMAASDNVLRAGLTAKHIDAAEMLAIVDYVAAPPIRIAPELVGPGVGVYYAPVDDFELLVARVAETGTPLALPGRSARVVLCVQGTVSISAGEQRVTLSPGEAAFVRADDPNPVAEGSGMLVQADVP